MSDKVSGRVASPPGSREPSPDGLGPSGFDPSRDSLFDYVQTSAWIGLVEFLLSQDWAIAQFAADTGVHLPRPRSGIDAMIDRATGFDGNMEFLRAFLPWVLREHWGEDEITPGIATLLAKLRDSDGSPKGGDAEGGSVRSTTARAEGIAQKATSPK